jgi:uncharacterized ubiquitin-like protein YukD
VQRNEQYDIDIPLDINASELLEGLSQAFDLDVNIEDSASCYIKTENPIALIHGRKTLLEYGIMNGSIINYTE